MNLPDLPSSQQAIVALLGVLFLWGGYSLRSVNLKEYFSTKTGLGILKGIVIVTVLFAAFSLVGCAGGTYVNDASVYAGLDYTNKISPQCLQGSLDDHTTSNIGMIVNGYRSEDEQLNVDAKYTHHSCAFGEDYKSYDAIGIVVDYKFWSK